MRIAYKIANSPVLVEIAASSSLTSFGTSLAMTCYTGQAKIRTIANRKSKIPSLILKYIDHSCNIFRFCIWRDCVCRGSNVAPVFPDFIKQMKEADLPFPTAKGWLVQGGGEQVAFIEFSAAA